MRINQITAHNNLIAMDNKEIYYDMTIILTNKSRNHLYQELTFRIVLPFKSMLSSLLKTYPTLIETTFFIVVDFPFEFMASATWVANMLQ